jgi:hypothetical protein
MTVWEAMGDSFIPTPKEGKWRSIAQGFNEDANFSNCVGAVDGKLIRIAKPGRHGPLYVTYNHYCSVVLLAVADSNFRFVHADAGSHGEDSYACIVGNSALWQKTSAQAVTNARYTNGRVNSSRARCVTLQRTAQRLTSVAA